MADMADQLRLGAAGEEGTGEAGAADDDMPSAALAC